MYLEISIYLKRAWQLVGFANRAVREVDKFGIISEDSGFLWEMFSLFTGFLVLENSSWTAKRQIEPPKSKSF